VLAFVGVKMLLSHWAYIPTLVSLGVIVAAVGASVVVSLLLTRGAESDGSALEAADRSDLDRDEGE